MELLRSALFFFFSNIFNQKETHADDINGSFKQWDAIRKSTPLLLNDDLNNVVELSPTALLKFNQNGMFRYVESLKDGTFVVLDTSAQEIWHLDIDGKIINKRNGFINPQEVSSDMEGNIYVTDGAKGEVINLDENGIFVAKFKDFDGISNIRACNGGEIYALVMNKEINNKYKLGIIRKYSRMGKLLLSCGEIVNSEFPEICKSEFIAPLVGWGSIILVSRQFPVMQIYSLDGELRSEIQIIEPRFSKRVIANNAININGKMMGAPIFKEAKWLGNNILLLMCVDQPGIGLIEVTRSGIIQREYIYKPQENGRYECIDFDIIINKNKRYLIGIIRGESNGIIRCEI